MPLGIGVAWLISLVPASSIWMNPVNAGLTNLPPRDLAHCAAHYSRVSNVSCCKGVPASFDARFNSTSWD